MFVVVRLLVAPEVTPVLRLVHTLVAPILQRLLASHHNALVSHAFQMALVVGLLVGVVLTRFTAEPRRRHNSERKTESTQ